MIKTRVCTTHEVVLEVPIADLAQMLFGERFNPNAKFQIQVDESALRMVQFDRQEQEPDPEPPPAVDPEPDPDPVFDFDPRGMR